MNQSLRRIVLLSTLSLAVFPAVQLPTTAAAANATDTGEANVVVVARFKGDTIGDGQTGLNANHPVRPHFTRWFQLKSEYADQHEPYLASTLTLDAYIRHASANQRKVSSFFPQDTSGTSGPSARVTYIDLPHTRAEYEASTEVPDLQLLDDVAAALNELDTPDSDQWDTNEDGAIDNLSVLVQTPISEPISASSPLLWPHHGRLHSQATVADLSIDHYTLIPARHTSTDSPDYTLGLNPSTVKQEYLGTLGLQPLYRSEASREEASGPVGPWDPMAKAANQYPLAQSREDLGWTTITTLPSTPGKQTITLYAPRSTLGPQAVRITPPRAGGESFILEYRQKGAYLPGPAPLDRNISRSGLLVYRVNPAVTEHANNTTGPDGAYRDYLYVFRPGATSLHSADGHLSEATLTAPTGRFAVAGNRHSIHSRLGSVVPSATISDDAIVDSRGRNTGLLVEITDQSESSITFTLEVPDDAARHPWEAVPTPQATDLTADALTQPSSATSSQGVAAVALRRPDGSLAVATQSNDAWASLGSPKLEAGKQWGTPALAWLGEQLYLLVPDNTEGATRAVLWAHNGTRWTQVAEQATLGPTSHPVLSALGTTLYALVGSDGEHAQLLQLSTSSTLEPVGPELPGHLVSPALTLTNATPTVVTGRLDGGSSQVLRLDGSTWITASSTPGLMRSNAVITWGEGSQERTLLARSTAPGTTQLTLLNATGQVLQEVQANGLPTSTSQLQLATSDGVAYLMATSGGSNTVEVYHAALGDLRNWTRLGEAVTASNGQATMTVTGKQVLVLAKNQQATGSTIYTFPAAAPAAPPAAPPADLPASQPSTGPSQTRTTPSPTPQASGTAPTAQTSATASPATGAPASAAASVTTPTSTPTSMPSPVVRAVPTPRPAPTTEAPSTRLPEPTPQPAPNPHIARALEPVGVPDTNSNSHSSSDASSGLTPTVHATPPVRPPLLPPGQQWKTPRTKSSASPSSSATPTGTATATPSPRGTATASTSATSTATAKSTPTASSTATSTASTQAPASPNASSPEATDSSTPTGTPQSPAPGEPPAGSVAETGDSDSPADGTSSGTANGTAERPREAREETTDETSADYRKALAPQAPGAADRQRVSADVDGFLPAGAEALPLRRASASGTKAHVATDQAAQTMPGKVLTNGQFPQAHSHPAKVTSPEEWLRSGGLATLRTDAVNVLCSCSGTDLATLLVGAAALGGSGAFLLALRSHRY
ncbi:hypothetical protein [Actinomyces trachealis]|uniref:hypothetical protein n=1 Tax=Actinomyces trachealis TaxID=2763540 RepID=UPI001892ACE4|nr:hypothetical protein [Actinomyces trachealis]